MNDPGTSGTDNEGLSLDDLKDAAGGFSSAGGVAGYAKPLGKLQEDKNSVIDALKRGNTTQKRDDDMKMPLK